jgi:hypothetical protein
MIKLHRHDPRPPQALLIALAVPRSVASFASPRS